MAKTSMIERDKKRIQMEKRYRKKRAALREAARQQIILGEIPWEELRKLATLPRNSSRIRIQRRCRYCGRPHAVYRKFGLCRLCLRKFAMKGFIPGLVKASW